MIGAGEPPICRIGAAPDPRVCRPGPPMNIHSPPPSSQPKPRVSADRGALLRTLINLWPYIWPSDRRDLKLRVLLSAVLLLAAKLATIAVPFTFKWATDALVGEGSAPFAPSAWL